MNVYSQRSPMSRTAKLITLICVIIMVVISVVPLLIDREMGYIAGAFVAVTLVAMTISGFFYMPRSIAVDNEALAICCPCRRKIIDINAIHDVASIMGDKGMYRVCGSGGFMGFWGWFYDKNFGRFFLYASNTDNLVGITLVNGKRYAISCDDATAMAAAIRRVIHPN